MMVWIVYASFLGNFLEGSIATIVKKQVGFALHPPRAALHQDSLEAAVFLIAAEGGQFINVNVDVAGNEQIDESVTVIVSPGCASAESAAGHSRFVGHILKLAVAHIAIERIAAVAGDVDIGKSVIVVIGDDDAHAPAFARQAGRLGDVMEFEAGVLMVERDHGIASIAETIDGGSIHGDDVEFPVVVAIDQASASAHGFHDVAFFWGRNVGNRQTNLLRNFRKSRDRSLRKGSLSQCGERKE